MYTQAIHNVIVHVSVIWSIQTCAYGIVHVQVSEALQFEEDEEANEERELTEVNEQV